MGDPREHRFLIVAGEASGDLHAAHLIASLRSLGPCRVRGVTGPALEAAGAERVAPISDLAVIGFSGVLGKLPRIARAYARLLQEAGRFRPEAAVLVDAPGFNFRIGPALRRRGIPIFYYIAPQVWAWHPERAAAMSRWVDRLAVVFPFEESLFRSAGVPVEFVGHPLLEGLEPEVNEATFRAELGLGSGDRILGLLPGSRKQEVRQHLGVMLESARRLRGARPDLAVVVGLAPGIDGTDELGAAGAAMRGAGGAPAGTGARITRLEDGVRLLSGRTRSIEAHATACAVASGTATLETALFGTPLAVVYRVGRINYAIARRLVKLTHIGLPNIVAGAEVAPELIQDGFTAERRERVLAPWLDDAGARRRAREGLGVVRERLGSPGASRRAAALLWRMVC